MKVGDKVSWLRTPRGGYGYVQRVPGTIAKLGEKRVTIEVLALSGKYVKRSVDSKNLQGRT